MGGHLHSSADAETVERTGQIPLCQLVFRHAALLPKLLLRLLPGAESAVHIDVLGPLGGIHQHQHPLSIDLKQAGRHGGAVVLTEPECTGDALYDAAASILASPAKCEAMARAMKELGIPDATERIYDAVTALVR